jgi:hypothetical protein
MKCKIGDKVMFTDDVVRRCGHDKHTADMRGTVVDILTAGKVVRVDTHGTYPNEDGNSVRCIPANNLTKAAY